MKKIRIENLQPGMILAKTIYSVDGKLLVREKTQLSYSLINRLREMGLPAAFVITSYDEEKTEALDVVTEKTRLELVKILANLDGELRLGKSRKSILPENKLVLGMLDEINRNRRAPIGLTDIRLQGDYIFGHSINVAVFGVRIGAELGYKSKQLYDLAVGCLLHDIGMTSIPIEILNKNENLTTEELAIIRSHPEKGFEIIRRDTSMPAVSAHVAYQHHERYNGSGYPRGMAGTMIHQFARIAAIADVYDALTTEKLYRKAYATFEAVKYIQERRNSEFDPELVDIFVKIINK